MIADMPSEFWSGWIIAVTVGSVLGLLWLVISIYFKGNQQQDIESPVWDETLQEGSNPGRCGGFG